MSFSRTECRKLRTGRSVSSENYQQNPLLGPAQEGARQQAQGSEPCKLALPASHHHLDVLPLFIFLLRRWIWLRRHDCPLRPGHWLAGAWSGWAAGADLGTSSPRRVLACPKLLSTSHGHRDWPRRRPRTSRSLGNYRPSLRPKPRKPSNDSAPQFEKVSWLAGPMAALARKAPWDRGVVTRPPPRAVALGEVNRWSRGGTLERVLLCETPRELSPLDGSCSNYRTSLGQSFLTCRMGL